MKKRFILLFTASLLGLATVMPSNGQTTSSAQARAKSTSKQEEKTVKDGKLKLSGYIQASFQHGMPDASLKVGKGNENKGQSFSRVGVRRGRLKATYTEKFLSGVLQIDLTEKGLSLKDAYINAKLPYMGASSFRAGVFDRPFGHEISFSSSKRESPERSIITQTLFPNERDLGAMLTLQPSKESAWHLLKLDAGLFAGNGIKPEIDSRLDFIGRLSAARKCGNWMEWGVGTSLYYGAVYQGSSKVYSMNNGAWSLDDRDGNLGAYAQRVYMGVDMQFSLYTDWGRTHLRGEWLTGKQPGGLESSKSPNSSSLPDFDTYIRPFQGGYALLVQDLGRLPLSALVKYDWYDPNTQVAGDAVGLNSTNKADIAYQTLGGGLLYKITPSLKLTAYYEFVNNEVSSSLRGYSKDRKDNRFSLVLQYLF